MSRKTEEREAEADELAKRAAKMATEIRDLHLELRRYRIALNRVAHPKSWGVNPGYHEEIARRALIIGQPVEDLPPGAAIVATPPLPASHPKADVQLDIEPGPWAKDHKTNQPAS